MSVWDQLTQALAAKATAKVNQKINGGQKTEIDSILESTAAYDYNLDNVLENERKESSKKIDLWVEIYRKSHYIDDAFKAFLDSPVKDRYYEGIDSTPADLRKAEFFESRLVSLMNHHFKLCADGYREGKNSTTTVYKYIGELLHFPEVDNQIGSWFKNASYFETDLGTAKSVLSSQRPIREQFQEILAEGLPDCVGKFAEIMCDAYEIMTYKTIKGRELADDEADVALVEKLMLNEVELKDFDELKRAILYLALENNRDSDNNTQFVMLSKLAEMTFGLTCALPEGGTSLYPGVDTMISKGIRYSKNGRIEEFDEILQDWLSTSYGSDLDQEQYVLLQKVFEELGAFTSEQILLEAMMRWNVDHTIEQENRLVFLKNNAAAIMKEVSKYAPVEVVAESAYKNTQQNATVIYDHRFHSWGASDVDKFFKSLTLSGKKHCVAAVVDKWAKNVTMESKLWSNHAVAEVLKRTIEEEFGEEYTVAEVKAGVVIDEEVDSTAAVYVCPTRNARYQDIAYLVVGEPMTKTQVHLSILVLVLPDEINSDNEKASRRIITVKEKNNPKLETFIETTKNIVTEQINKWVVETAGNADIY